MEPTERYTVAGLQAAVEHVLSRGEPPLNGQVRAVPDLRTIRYYTTLGLLDRPAEMVGRTAYYGRTHLLQLVAIKRLQTEGLKLVDVQARLAGATTATLEAIAALPAAGPAALPPAPAAPPAAAPAGTTVPGRHEGFWRARPAARGAAATSEPVREPGVGPAPMPSAAPRSSTAVSLPGGTVLVLPPGIHVDDDTARSIREAAMPLLAHLHQMGLTGPEPTEETTP
jgi:DNA-binding transcriptional MerR regulator